MSNTDTGKGLTRYQYKTGGYQMRDGDVAVYYIIRFGGSRWSVSRDAKSEKIIGGPPFTTLTAATAWCERLYETEDRVRVEDFRAMGYSANLIAKALREGE